ncbi:MAG TPA: hypothetical protein VKU40_09150 [Thermoanaerobaculia bacterium]|nr:hypothetical protein [Thermoanaerobaculia bacterium]
MSEIINPPSYRTAVARRAPLGWGARLVVGCGFIVLLAVVAFVAWSVYLGTRTVPEGIEVEVEVPEAVRLGDSFEVVARVINNDERGHSLVDLDVAESFLAGIVIERTEPPFAESVHVPVAQLRTYTYDLALPAGRTVEVRLQAFAADTGEHAGRFGFCIDSKAQCTSDLVRLVVLPALQEAVEEGAEGGA